MLFLSVQFDGQSDEQGWRKTDQQRLGTAGVCVSNIPPQDEKIKTDAILAGAGIANSKVQDADLLDLWKYFQGRADMLKERQWTVGTWILTLLSGNIAFALSQETVTITEAGIGISKPLPALVLGVIGIIICMYGIHVLRSYREHIQRNWTRADLLRRRIMDLDFFWKAGLPVQTSSGRKSTDESLYLIRLVDGFLIFYIIMSLVSLIAAL
jgi:hypothetical protein